ncbi:MAG: multidrug effflux MFS transporter [Zoogloeaceae bacterium]|jgi:DHA1 family bicyclomycin/chloramphenicol resistance-like MFS transporter|nr:multidrug effflux MFS transporter [Zoogloeaceae bacterium]
MNAHRKNLSLTLVLAALAAVGPFSIDAYLPAFPEMSEALATDLLGIQQTLSIYMLTFGLMTLWHGAVSDSFGRRRVILLGLLVYALASLGCALSQSIEMLWTMRAIQGMSAGVGMVVSRAMVRDLYEGASAQRLMANIAIMFAVAPAIAPIIGGWMLRLAGWRSIFIFLAVAASLLYIVCWRRLPESLPPEKRQPFAIRPLMAHYKSILTHPPFLALSLGIGASFAGYFVYVLSAPVFIREHLGLDETEFYWLFVPSMIGMMAGSWFSGRIAGRWNDRRTISLSFMAMGFAALANLLISEFLPGSLVGAILPFILYNLGIAIAMPNLTLISLDMFPHNRGMAASCQSFVQTIANAALAAFIVPRLWHNRIGLALGMTGLCALGAFLVWRYGMRTPKTENAA